MINCCIFDLDGTLLNTIPSITHYINETFQKWGFSEISEEDTRRFIGNGASKLIERALRSVGAYSEDVHAEVLRSYNAAYDSDPYYLTEPYRGIPELVLDLKERRVALAVLSNKPHSTTELCVRHFFGDSFDFILGGKEGVPLKPAKESTETVLRTLGKLPSATAFIGDSDVDILTGRNAGVALTLGCAWGFRGKEELLRAGADIVADTPRAAHKALLEKL